jgi:hypothetical protein
MSQFCNAQVTATVNKRHLKLRHILSQRCLRGARISVRYGSRAFRPERKGSKRSQHRVGCCQWYKDIASRYAQYLSLGWQLHALISELVPHLGLVASGKRADGGGHKPTFLGLFR